MPRGSDPLCPLGFHPQVRWPTRCKRCFREYKEHVGARKSEDETGGFRKDAVTASSPTLNLSYTSETQEDDDFEGFSEEEFDEAPQIKKKHKYKDSESSKFTSTTTTTTNSNRYTSHEGTGSNLATSPQTKTEMDIAFPRTQWKETVKKEDIKDYSSPYSSLSTQALAKLGMSKYKPVSRSWSAQDLRVAAEDTRKQMETLTNQIKQRSKEAEEMKDASSKSVTGSESRSGLVSRARRDFAMPKKDLKGIRSTSPHITSDFSLPKKDTKELRSKSPHTVTDVLLPKKDLKEPKSKSPLTVTDVSLPKKDLKEPRSKSPLTVSDVSVPKKDLKEAGSKSPVTVNDFSLPKKDLKETRSPSPQTVTNILVPRKDVKSKTPQTISEFILSKKGLKESSSKSSHIDSDSSLSQKDSHEASSKPPLFASDKAKIPTRRIQIQSLQEIAKPVEKTPECSSADVEFIIQVKKSGKKAQSQNDDTFDFKKMEADFKKRNENFNKSNDEADFDDEVSIADTEMTEMTETTETTLVDHQNVEALQDEIYDLKRELEKVKTKCERLEKEKSETVSKHYSAVDNKSARIQASELLKLQQKVNELQSLNEDLCDEKKSLKLRVKELEAEVESRPLQEKTQKTIEDLRAKLHAAETLCEELMEENTEMKKEIRDLEEEIEEMQDNFREDLADEYRDLKKELEQAAKNCRILQFKLRKSERTAEELEGERGDMEKRIRNLTGGEDELKRIERIQKLEKELEVSKEVATRFQKQVEELTANKNENKIKENLTRRGSGSMVSRTRSLDSPMPGADNSQLLRDLQDTIERETDLKEQLKFAEEEAASLRKKLSRLEEENETLVLQLKKMANKSKAGRRRSPSPAHMIEKDEGISDDMDPADLRLQLELNEQESAVMRKKIEEMENENSRMQKEVKDLTEKLLVSKKTDAARGSGSDKPREADAYTEQKIKVIQEEADELRKKLIEKERDNERLETELRATQKKGGKVMVRSRSLDSDSQALDLKRQLQVVEQEAAILRNKTMALEGENEKLAGENKRLQLRVSRKPPPTSTELLQMDKAELTEKVNTLEKKLSTANTKINELSQDKVPTGDSYKADKSSKLDDSVEMETLKKEKDVLQKDLKKKEEENEDLKTQMGSLEREKEKVSAQLKKLKELSNYSARPPKKSTDIASKVQLKKMVDDLEEEIGELYIVIQSHETEKKKISEELKKKEKGGKESHSQMARGLEEEKKKSQQLAEDLRIEKERAEAAEKERKKIEKEKKKAENDRSRLEEEGKKLEAEKKQAEEERKELEEEKRKLHEMKDTVEEENRSLEEELAEMKKKVKQTKATEDDLEIFKQRIEALKRDLAEEKSQHSETRKKMDEGTEHFDHLRKAVDEKHKLQKELTEVETKVAEGEKKVKETEDKLKKSQKLATDRKGKLATLEKELEEEREKVTRAESTQKEMSVGWLKERGDLKKQVTETRSKMEDMQTEIAQKEKKIKEMEATQREENKKMMDILSKKNEKEIKSVTEEKNTLKTRVEELQKKLTEVEEEKKTIEGKYNKIDEEFRQQKEALGSKATDLEVELKGERKKQDKRLQQLEQEIKKKGEELAEAKERDRRTEKDAKEAAKKFTELKEAYCQKTEEFEKKLMEQEQEYEDLTTKYELLEEDYVVVKARLVMEKEEVESNFKSLKKEYDTLNGELRNLRDTFNLRQDTWIKEKLDQQEQLKELEEKLARCNTDSWYMEKHHLKQIIEERDNQVNKAKRESGGLRDQISFMKKENDEVRKKLEDYERMAKRSITVDNTAVEKEIRELKNKLAAEDKSHRMETSQVKMRYDSKLALAGEEVQSMQTQLAKLKRERDTYKDMLDSAQKAISDLKTDKKGRSIGLQGSEKELEDARTKVIDLQQQINTLEDELNEGRLESSKLKGDLITETSKWELKVAELHTRINELEEEKVMMSGRTRIAGVRSKMELAWQKEREEQQRLLQEASSLSRDLRQTLFEVEKERDRERLEAKRKLEQLSKGNEEEGEEMKKKITQLQCDLLELRDAHAKLRTTNEKVRRDKERYEKEKEEQKQKILNMKRTEADEQRKVVRLMNEVQKVRDLSPAVLGQPLETTQTKDVPKGEENVNKTDFKEALQKIGRTTEELRKILQISDDEKERERVQRSMPVFRRAASTEESSTSPEPDDPISRWKTPQKTSVYPAPPPSMLLNPQKRGSLYRKSLSLEQNISAQNEQGIWKSQDDAGSSSSLQSLQGQSQGQGHYHYRGHGDGGNESGYSSDSYYNSLPMSRSRRMMGDREPSFDRLSTGSSKSEITPGPDKKKKGLIGKLKTMTKSKSIEDTTTGDLILNAGVQALSPGLGGSGSDISVGSSASEYKEDKKGIKGQFKKIFKKDKSAPSSRSQSVERVERGASSRGGTPVQDIPQLSHSQQRPLQRQSSTESTSSASSVPQPPAPSSSPAPPVPAHRKTRR